MKYQQLVVNGCSYMNQYGVGQGHQDLAKMLNIPLSENLALSGSANGRILRTTLKHSYTVSHPTFYVLGMTFLSRDELPICKIQNLFEGRWSNPQNQDFKELWNYPWTQKDTDTYVDLKLKWESVSIIDRLEDLQYRMLATISDVKSRGHGILVYNQADIFDVDITVDPLFRPMAQCKHIVHGYAWQSVPWQHKNNVPPTIYPATNKHKVPPELVHPRPGYHTLLNEYLVKYINDYCLLE